ncbi:MAG: cytochrome b/b6 domain-containing protein [Candidatus Thiodiazotropha endolucinida]
MIQRYHYLVVITHWLSAILIVCAIGVGMGVLADMHNSNPDKVDFLRIHVIGGILILVLTLIRIMVRLWKPVPSSDYFENSWLNRSGRSVHILLYAVLLGVLVSGIGISALSGLPDIVFFGKGQLPDTFRTFPPHAAHGVLALIFSVLLLLHIFAAIYHQLIRKDDIFSRMWYGKIRKSNSCK